MRESVRCSKRRRNSRLQSAPLSWTRNAAAIRLLRREIEALLDADAQGSGFIDEPIAAIPADLLTEEDFAGRQFGAYRVLREIGRGGLGAVYLAARADEQDDRRRAVDRGSATRARRLAGSRI